MQDERQVTSADTGQMSEASSLFNIFFEPGRTFDDLRRKPRFILALVLMAILITAFSFAFYYKVGEDNFRSFITEQISKSSQASAMDAEQKAGAVDMQMNIATGARYATPVIVALFFAFGGFIYWLAGKAFGGSGNYFHALSTWVYSSLPPTVISMLANFIILFFKAVDDIDIGTSQTGVVQANLSFLIDRKGSPVLATLLGSFDVFLIWGWILAAIGLQRTQKISSGSAWAITLIVALVGIAMRVIGSLVSGNPS
ncbi:MAG: Yip1 family protein [Pyrinomonadaceae bacterium]